MCVFLASNYEFFSVYGTQIQFTHQAKAKAWQTKFDWRRIDAVVSQKAIVLIAPRAVDCSQTRQFANMMHVHATDPLDILSCLPLPPETVGV